MAEIGYKLASEEHGPRALVRHARAAEDAGFAFGMISDHFHPWTRDQGQSPFVWSVIGGIAEATDRLRIATGVTCPTIRIHPAIIAQAAATAASMMPGRFVLGVGSGENLNEHIFGGRWPPARIRTAMLEEAVGVIRQLWRGGMQDFRGRYYTVEDAELFTLPDIQPPILVAAMSPRGAELAARIGDGLVTAGIHAESTLEHFRDAGGAGRPAYIELTACHAADEASARRIAHRQWPIPANPGDLNVALATPAQYEHLASAFEESAVADKVICGPDPDKYIARLQALADAGFDHIFVHQIGPAQQEFLDFFGRDVMPSFA